MTRVAILDDYQDVALSMADWKSLPDGPRSWRLRDHLDDPGAVAKRLADFDVVVAMRERTAFPRALLERLPQAAPPRHHRHAQRVDRRGGGDRARASRCAERRACPIPPPS